MLKTELLEIIANGENSGVEFKRDDIRQEQLAKEIVAMLNLNGGKVLLGVEDDGSISGLQRESSEEWVMQAINSKVHPQILPYYEEIRMDDENIVAVVSFPAGISKPYVLRHQSKEEIFIRVGSTSRIATREQQMRLFELGGMLHTELLPVPRSDFHSLDKARLENYLRDILQDPDVPSDDASWRDRLLGLGFLTKANDQICCTIAGLVLFGKQPRHYLKQAGIRLMVFDGPEKSYDAKLDEILDGPMVGRWEGNTLVDSGVIERFVDAMSPFIAEQANEIGSTFRREDKWLYPKEAVRETILNALAHRDWTRFIEIEVVRYADRLEVISPGTLPNSMSVKKMEAGQRSPRNTTIMEVLRDYGYVEVRGMGVRKKIIPLTRAHNGKDPRFDVNEDQLTTTLFR